MSETTTAPVLTFRAPASTRVGAKRGRPEKFTPAMQDALRKAPGQTAVIQENVKSESRVSALKKRYPEFVFVTERHEGFVNILAEFPKPKRAPRAAKPKPTEVAVEAPAAE